MPNESLSSVDDEDAPVYTRSGQKGLALGEQVRLHAESLVANYVVNLARTLGLKLTSVGLH